MKTYEYPIQIKEHHLDTFGHVNNATYLSLFEEARWELITEKGITLESIHHKAQGPVILEVSLKFMRELRNREWIKIESRFLGFKGKVGKIEQVMKNADGADCCRAEFVFGVFDTKARKLITPPSEWTGLS